MRSYLERMQAAAKDADPETAHADADQILLDIACEAGYSDVADLFFEIEKWYS